MSTYFAIFRPYTKVIESAFLSLSLLFAKQCSSASQWEAENFVKIVPTSNQKVDGKDENSR